jgi:hypothetical protein
MRTTDARPTRMLRPRLATAFVTGLALVPVISACGSSQKRTEVRPDSQLLGVEIRGDTETEKYDLNGDGRPDLFRIHVLRGPKENPEARTKVLARQDLDLNFDDLIDMRRHFNEAGVVVREEMDLDFDSKFDAIDYFADGTLYRRDMGLNFQARATIVKFFTNNKVVRKERDTNEDGRMDTFEYFEDGRLVRIGVDRDGDEIPDVYTENNTPAPAAPTPPAEKPTDKPANAPAPKPVEKPADKLD